MKHSVLAGIKSFRRDMGNLLFHFTRSRPGGALSPTVNLNPFGPPPPPTAYEPKTAFEVLTEILTSGKLIGTSGFVKGKHQCVSFTEWPVSELASMFAINNELAKGGERPRYEPYGIAVKKDWLFQKNGRPVIYQPESEYSCLPPTIQWRHVRYEPPQVDFTWEREWRVPCSELQITASDVLVLVRTSAEAHSVTYGFSQLTTGPHPKTGANVTWSNPSWMAVSLDLFGM